jgi:hypothetical protein
MVMLQLCIYSFICDTIKIRILKLMNPLNSFICSLMPNIWCVNRKLYVKEHVSHSTQHKNQLFYIWSTKSLDFFNIFILFLAIKVFITVKGKVVPVLLLSTMPWRRMGEWRYSSTHSLTLALDGGKWSSSRPGCFTSRERDPGTQWIGANFIKYRIDLQYIWRIA